MATLTLLLSSVLADFADFDKEVLISNDLQMP